MNIYNKNNQYLYCLVFVLSASFIGMNAEIQDGKIVAGAVMVRNYSRRAVRINGYEVKGGHALYLDLEKKSGVVLNLLSWYKLVTGNVNERRSLFTQEKALIFNANNTFVFSSAAGVSTALKIPALDPNKPYIQYGRDFNAPLYFGSDLRGELLEYDVTVLPKWIFGQDVTIGRRFEFAQKSFN